MTVKNVKIKNRTKAGFPGSEFSSRSSFAGWIKQHLVFSLKDFFSLRFSGWSKTTGKSTTGFSLVEMVTVVAIMILMVTAMLISNSQFGDNLLLSNLSYDISSTIRQAQSYGLSTKNWKETRGVLGEGFDVGYGIRFAEDDNKKFIMFSEILDSTGANNWHCGVDGDTEPIPLDLAGCKNSKEFMKEYLISGQNTISKICAINTDTQVSKCSPGISYLDIIFKKSGLSNSPEPDAYISTNLSNDPNRYNKVEITLLAKTGFTKKIVVTQIGQISVQ